MTSSRSSRSSRIRHAARRSSRGRRHHAGSTRARIGRARVDRLGRQAAQRSGERERVGGRRAGFARFAPAARFNQLPCARADDEFCSVDSRGRFGRREVVKLDRGSCGTVELLDEQFAMAAANGDVAIFVSACAPAAEQVPATTCRELRIPADRQAVRGRDPDADPGEASRARLRPGCASARPAVRAARRASAPAARNGRGRSSRPCARRTRRPRRTRRRCRRHWTCRTPGSWGG